MQICGKSSGRSDPLLFSPLSFFFQGKITLEDLSSQDSGVLAAVTAIRLLVNSKSSNAVRLVDHLEDIEKTEDWKVFQAVVSFVRDRCKINEFLEEEILHALGVLSSNACNMAGFRARALFPVYSLINHSCAANARNIVNSEDGTVEVLAQRKIKKGEEICIRYLSFTNFKIPIQLSQSQILGTAVNYWNRDIKDEASSPPGDHCLLLQIITLSHCQIVDGTFSAAVQDVGTDLQKAPLQASSASNAPSPAQFFLNDPLIRILLGNVANVAQSSQLRRRSQGWIKWRPHWIGSRGMMSIVSRAS